MTTSNKRLLIGWLVLAGLTLGYLWIDRTADRGGSPVPSTVVTVAAILVTPVYLAKWDNGEAIGLTAFIEAIVGGFNQVRGAVLGGVLVGVLENFSAYYISTEYRTAFPLILLILVIMFRPYGLLGRPEERTV